MSESDTTFLQKLYEFINQEKKNLQCPEEGPNELRYIVYRSAFIKVIGRTTAFKRLLLIIKSEYDNIIRQLKRREKAEESEQRGHPDTQIHKFGITHERFMRLSCVMDRLTCWEQERQEVPLEGVLGSTLQNIQHLGSGPNVEGHGSFCNIDCELFEDEEPTGVDESKLLQDHLDSFVELLESAQYEEAALHAARSPRGVLRNADTMELFAGVQAPPASTPPALLFFRALLFTTAKGDRLSGDVSLQGVRCSLQHGNIHLVTHAVSQDKLMFTEELGDILTEHAQNNHHVLDQCLALASIVYEACKQHQVVLQLLDSLMSREQDVLENVILEDSSSSVDVWDQVASRCSDLNRADLSRAIRSILLRQNGTGVLSSDPDGARLMEHVFL
uniref:Clathrin heavy chain linker domain containing 1 n=1 Tax=Nothobranchius kuhntae TaxID=321403 RepID=A0A1A8J4U5_NOTKU